MSEDMIQDLEKGSHIDRLAYTEIGSTGLNRWGNNVVEEFLPQLQWPRAAKIYKEMSDNDASIGSILYMTEQLIRRCDWKVRAASDSEADKAAAAFVEECMGDMSTTWEDTIAEILSFFIYGWSFHEIVYKVRKGPQQKEGRYRSKFDDGRIGWRKMPIRSQQTLDGWVFDEDDGCIKAMIQVAPPHYKRVEIPLSKGLLFRTKVARDNPEGRSLLRNAYRPWYFKKRIEEIEGIGIERDLAGLPVLIPPEGTDLWSTENPQANLLRQRAEQIVQSIRRDQNEGVVLSHGWELKLLSTGGSRQFDTNAIINRYDQRIAITLLADIVMLGADKVGSFALADVKKSLLSASLEAQVWNIANIFNKYAIPDLISMNHFPGITGFPTLEPSEIEMPDIKQLGDFFRAVGMSIEDDYELDSYLRSVASMPKQTEDEFKARQEAKRAKALAEEAAKIAREEADIKVKEEDEDDVKQLGDS